MADASSDRWERIGWQRVRALWPAKVILTIIVGVLFWVPYLYLSHHPFFSVHVLPLTGIDRWAGFRPHTWAWVYESIFLLSGGLPWLIDKREALRRYVMGFATLSVASFMIFLLFPVAAPRPTDLEGSAFLIFITNIDGPLNAFPSLHAGCLVYTLGLARRMFGFRAHPVAAASLVAWVGLILFATLATKQHYALDLLAGGLLGATADWFAWRNFDGTSLAGAGAPRNVDITPRVG